MHLDFAWDMISAETLPIDLEIFSLRDWGFMVYRFYSTDSAAKISSKGRKGAQRKTHSLYQIVIPNRITVQRSCDVAVRDLREFDF
jgi:hypothetical protein